LKSKGKIQKKVPSSLKSSNKKLSSIRPWGRYKVLEETERWKVKRIMVKPGQRLSYQKHLRRKEHWLVVRGEGVVVLDGRESDSKQEKRLTYLGVLRIELAILKISRWFSLRFSKEITLGKMILSDWKMIMEENKQKGSLLYFLTKIWC